MLLVPSKGEVVLAGIQRYKQAPLLAVLGLSSPPPTHPQAQCPLLCGPESHPISEPVIPAQWVLAWGHYLHSSEELVLDMAAPKLLLHRGPCGCVQHLQPHLKGGGGAEP